MYPQQGRVEASDLKVFKLEFLLLIFFFNQPHLIEYPGPWRFL